MHLICSLGGQDSIGRFPIMNIYGQHWPLPEAIQMWKNWKEERVSFILCCALGRELHLCYLPAISSAVENFFPSSLFVETKGEGVL